MILVGNKSDLEGVRAVSSAAIAELTKEYSIDYVEISALQNKKVNTVFEILAKGIRKNYFDSFKFEKSSMSTNETNSQFNSRIHIRLSKERKMSRGKKSAKRLNGCC